MILNCQYYHSPLWVIWSERVTATAMLANDFGSLFHQNVEKLTVPTFWLTRVHKSWYKNLVHTWYTDMTNRLPPIQMKANTTNNRFS